MPTYTNTSGSSLRVPFGKKEMDKGEVIESFMYITDAELPTYPGLERTLETPYFPIAAFTESKTYTVAGWYAFEDLIDYKVIRVTTTVRINITANAQANTNIYTLFANKTIDINNEGRVIDQLHVYATAGGEVIVQGLIE
jgi:hypothetical protein